MGYKSVNEFCKNNREYLPKQEFKGFTIKKPPKEFNGC